MIHKGQLIELVKQTLMEIDLYSPSAANLVLGTIAQESGFGEYLKQLGGGPAKGISQIEPATFRDIVFNYLVIRHFKLSQKIKEICNIDRYESDTLVFNLKLSIAITRVFYLRFPEPLPDADDISGLATYWKTYYNTYLGSGTEQRFIDNYKKYVK